MSLAGNHSIEPQMEAVRPRSGRRVEVSGIWKRYGAGAYVVRDVSFDLRPGEFLTLLGPSGSGKTTCLMMVAGFEAPDSGEIRVDGRDIAGQPPERRNFGVVFQGYALFPHMTVLENVGFALRMKGVRAGERRRRSLEMIERVGLAPFALRRPRELSGGQQQRVALARALVFEPDALLLDEPLGALDRKLRESLQAEIKEIQARIGISILFVTHDQDEAMMMSDRIAVMAEGRIVQIGAPADLYLHPATSFVAGFLGETNLLRGLFKGMDHGHAAVAFADGTLGLARLPASSGDPGPHPRHNPRPNPRIGDEIIVSVRPERIRIGLPADALKLERGTVFSGVVSGCTFLGRHARYLIQAQGQTLSVSTTEWSPGAAIASGTRVRLSFGPEEAQILGDADAWDGRSNRG